MVNRLINGFLEDVQNKDIYKNYLKNPTDTNKEKVEEAFRLYAMKIKILSYFSKALFFEAQRFDKKMRRHNAVPLLENDEVIDDRNNQDLIYAEEGNSENLSLEDFFENESLYNVITNLNDSNKKLLYLLYVKDLNEAQVASKLGITKQAVNKRKNNLLKKIKKNLL